MVVTDELRELILQREDANNIRKLAMKQGMISLRDSAIDKLMAGQTTLDEVLRLTQLEN